MYSPFVFFFNDTATTEIYTLSLHDALPIFASLCTAGSRYERRWRLVHCFRSRARFVHLFLSVSCKGIKTNWTRSEEHTSELQSRQYLVCRLLLEKKNTQSSLVQTLIHVL